MLSYINTGDLKDFYAPNIWQPPERQQEPKPTDHITVLE